MQDYSLPRANITLGFVVGRVIAADSDGDPLHYALLPSVPPQPYDAYFTINATDGLIRIAQVFTPSSGIIPCSDAFCNVSSNGLRGVELPRLTLLQDIFPLRVNVSDGLKSTVATVRVLVLAAAGVVEVTDVEGSDGSRMYSTSGSEPVVITGKG